MAGDWRGAFDIRGSRLFALLVAVALATGVLAAGSARAAAPDSARVVGAAPARAISGAGSARIGTNLSFVKDWSTEHPFVDIFKTARPWIPNDVDSFEWDSGVAVPVDARGWPPPVLVVARQNHETTRCTQGSRCYVGRGQRRQAAIRVRR